MEQKSNLIDPDLKDHLRTFMPQYLSMKGIDYRRPFRCLSPSHQDNTPSMSFIDFYKGKPLYKIRCFSCGASYDIFDLVCQDFGLKDMREAAFKIGELFGVHIDGQKATVENRTVPAAPIASVTQPSREYKEYDITERITQAHANVGQTDYFLSRGFSPAIINEYKLGYWPGGYNDFVSPISADLTYRMLQQKHYTYIVPILDEHGTPRNFIARMNDNGTVDEYNPKTLNMRGVQMRFLNERYLESPAAFLNGAKSLFIVEGWADALSIEQAGGKAIALNTTANVERFLRMCAAHANELRGLVIIGGGDRDKAGQEMNLKLERGIPEHNVPGLMSLGLRFMPFNVAGFHKDANEYLIKDSTGFTSMVSGVIENRLGRFRFSRKPQDMEL